MSEVKIKLTTLQGEILSHRLEVPDAISEVLADELVTTVQTGNAGKPLERWRWKYLHTDPDDNTMPLDVEKIAEGMLQTIAESGYIDIGAADSFRRWIAAELLTGSTYYACAMGELRQRELSKLRRSLNALEQKFEAHGERITTPTW